MIVLLFVIMIPVIYLYNYSNKVSVGVVREEIQNANYAQLTFLSKQLDNQIDQLSMLAITLSNDPNVKEFQGIQTVDTMYSNYSSVKTHQLLEQKLKLQSASNHWTNTLSVYSPNAKKAVSSRGGAVYDESALQDRLTADWVLQKPAGQPAYFMKHITSPIVAKGDISRMQLVTEITFPIKNIQDILEQYKAGKKNNPFLYSPSQQPIQSFSGDQELTRSLVQQVEGSSSIQRGRLANQIMEMNGQNYLVNIVEIHSLHWYLVDYVPLQHMLAPITKSRNLFYMSVSVLLFMSVIVVVFLYKHVQVPIRELVHSVQRLKKGDYSVRIVGKNNDFQFLFLRFNEMAEEIGSLIQHVYAERIRSKEATLKHLQSQINPHFLYNCLAFIRSMTRLGEKEAVMDMALHLGNYYRYTTRNERQITSLGEELELVRNYLTIQNLQTQRLDYDMAVPDSMLALELPRLTLQPIVENCIKYGVERKRGTGIIRILGEEDDRFYTLVVEDNGPGMEASSLELLRRTLIMPLEDEMGCGLWNVHQRLLYHFGEESGLLFENIPDGGLRVSLKLQKKANAEG
ncbi:sensor histidine kinase [Paenibacillus gansuensis]|uniref:Sensor histidine kinase n=1 Tax=Paenibacillus gansuensis TaxID=306542 RepID=A0ABW5P886_9BACL